ncbi:MAG: ornithine carbamoyltransferase [Oligoflexia bacterium]|nr:ornithine carbamoyltransferase [Oligoflexia bacterium]
MPKPPLSHFLTGEELPRAELFALLEQAEELRQERRAGHRRQDLAGRSVALLFDKPSLRTRISFAVAIAELGGNPIESVAATRKHEEPEDIVRVLGGYCDALVIRTHEHAIVERMVSKAPVPVVNGLSDSHHPCQVLADLLTLRQYFGKLEGLKFTYIGDGNNMLHSMLLLMPFLGIHVTYACPPGYEPNAFISRVAEGRAREGGGSITAFTDPVEAIRGTNAVYTDVWTSMGFEAQEFEREAAFANYQLNEALYAHAAPGALIMHCMPMIRGKEISETLPEHENSVLFRQSENRLHAQKALLLKLLGKGLA